MSFQTIAGLHPPTPLPPKAPLKLALIFDNSVYYALSIVTEFSAPRRPRRQKIESLPIRHF